MTLEKLIISYKGSVEESDNDRRVDVISIGEILNH